MSKVNINSDVNLQALDTAINNVVRFVEINSVRIACLEKILALIGFKSYVTGSRSEGIHVGSSDTDIICDSSDIIAIPEGDTLSEKSHLEVLVDTSLNRPGYGRLRLRSEDLNKSIQITKSFQKPVSVLCNDIAGTFYLSNEKGISAISMHAASKVPWVGGRVTNIAVNGPAKNVTVEMGREENDLDILWAIPCRTTIQDTIKWQDRQRAWPSKNIMEKASASPVFLVPIGHPLSSSEDKDCQWKFSFNLQERILTRSLNGSQLICCHILKVLKYHLKEIKNQYGFKDTTIKSYFFKTSFMWTLEHIPNTEWCIETIIPNNILCIEYFSQCLKKGFLPQYFIPEQNLLEGKVDKADAINLANFLLSICRQDHPLWLQLLHKVTTVLNKVYIKKQPLRAAVSTCRNLLILSVKTTSPAQALKELNQHRLEIENLPTDAGVYDTDFKHSIVISLQSHIGTLQHLLGGTNVDSMEGSEEMDFCSTKLKVATILYWSGNLSKASEIARMVIDRNATNMMYYTGFTHVKDPTFNDVENCAKDWNTLTKHNICYDLLFISSEKALCLPAVQLQLCEGRGFVINPLVYAYYLQFCTLRKQNVNKRHMIDVLQALETLVNGRVKAGFHFTDWEILSYCYLQLGAFPESYQHLLTSAKKRDSGTAHLWLLALIVYQTLVIQG